MKISETLQSESQKPSDAQSDGEPVDIDDGHGDETEIEASVQIGLDIDGSLDRYDKGETHNRDGVAKGESNSMDVDDEE